MKRLLIILILLLAFSFRFISIVKYPVGFNADEASFGYDAYSILHTGRDQWGNFMPLVLKSFGDYKSPLYAYLAVPSVAVFGLTVFATRLPNVIIGTLAVLAVYLLVNEICKRTKWLNGFAAKWLGTLTAFLLAVNPWAIMMSRGAFEANLITFFLPLGIYFFLKGLKEDKFFAWSALFLGLDLFTYHSAKLITPLVLAGLVLIFRKELSELGIKKLAVPVSIFVLFFGALLFTFIIGGGSRITERSITQGALVEGFQERMTAIANGDNSRIAKIFHNKYTVITNRFTTNYLQYFSPKFLIQSGAGDGTYGMLPGIGVVYFLEFIFLFGVIPLLFIEKRSRKLVFILLAWLAVTPLTGALASGIGYSGNRAEGMLPVLQIVEAFGLVGWLIMFKKLKFSPVKFLDIVFVGYFVFEIWSFGGSYFKTPSSVVSGQMLYGNLELSDWLMQNSVGRKVLISRSISEPQIFLAFTTKWDPADFQKTINTWNFDKSGLVWVDQLPAYSLGNYTIKSIDWKTDITTGSLIVTRATEVTGNQIPVKIINYPDGTAAIYIIDTSQKTYAKAI